jgi:hypothetical protein
MNIRVDWNVPIGSKPFVSISATVNVVDASTFGLDLDLGAGGDLFSDSASFADVVTWDQNLTRGYPQSIQWSTTCAGGTVSVTVAINGIVVGTLVVNNAYDTSSGDTSGPTTEVGITNTIRQLWTTDAQITTEDFAALEDAWKRTFSGYVDPDPTCTPPT